MNAPVENTSDKIRVTKEFRFEMAHALLNYDGPCRNIHGHSYILQVTYIGLPLKENDHPADGLVVDFKEIKKMVQLKVINDFDHALIINRKTPENIYHLLKMEFDKIITVPFQPSCENLLLEIKRRMQNTGSEQAVLFSLKLFETSTCWAEWYLTDNN